MEQPREYTALEREQIKRFVSALNHAMVSSRGTQRELADRLGLSVGTITKYLKGTVPPLNVCLANQAALARLLGVSLDALYAYYTCGEYVTHVTIADVGTWIRSEAGQESLPWLMECVAEASRRWQPNSLSPDAPAASILPAFWGWPLEELDSAEISERVRDRLTLTPERMRALVELGEYDDDLIEGFAVACNFEEVAVREAFEKREAIS